MANSTFLLTAVNSTLAENIVADCVKGPPGFINPVTNLIPNILDSSTLSAALTQDETNGSISFVKDFQQNP